MDKLTIPTKNGEIVETYITGKGKLAFRVNNRSKKKSTGNKIKNKPPMKPATHIPIAEWQKAGFTFDTMPVCEYRFCLERKWRIDYAFPELKIAIEIEGGIYIGGRHINPKGYIKDQEKYNKMAEEGWLLLRYQPRRHNMKQIKATIQKRIQSITGIKKEGFIEHLKQH